MLRFSLPVGRAVGATVRVHWTALVIAALLGFALVVDLGVVVGTIGVVSFFVAILVHELAHALVARRFGIRTETIELWGLGGMARLDRDPSTPRAEGFIAAAGPLSNAVVGGLAVAVAYGLDGVDGARDRSSSRSPGSPPSTSSSAAFNVLPGAPLDGGRVVRAVRWSQHGSRYRAMREAAYVGSILGWGLVALGVSFALSGRSGVWMIVSGLFVAMSARVDVLTASIGERIGPAKVNEFTWFGVAEVGPDMDVDSMIWQRSRLGGAGAVAIRGDGGRLDGLVLEDQLWAVPSERRPWTMLTSLMAPLDRLPRADVDDDLAGVLPRVHPLRPVITVWRDGRLLGVVPPKVVRERIENAGHRVREAGDAAT